MGHWEAEQRHLLAMVEAAQRAGRSENEIVHIVERYFGEQASQERLEQGLLRRLSKRAA